MSEDQAVNTDITQPRRPWLTEPDHQTWTDLTTGLECRIHRHPGHGYLCGYVALPPGHHWVGRHHSDMGDIEAGITYSEDRFPYSAPDGRWVVGFDCGHSDDLTPKDAEAGTALPGTVYRTIQWVRARCAELAREAVPSGGATRDPSVSRDAMRWTPQEAS